MTFWNAMTLLSWLCAIVCFFVWGLWMERDTKKKRPKQAQVQTSSPQGLMTTPQGLMTMPNSNLPVVQVNPQMAMAVREALDTCSRGSGLLVGWYRNKNMKQRVETMQYLNSFLSLANRAGMETAAQQYGLTGALYEQLVMGRFQMEMRILEKEHITEIETRAEKEKIWTNAEAEVWKVTTIEESKNKSDKERAQDETEIAFKAGPLSKLQRSAIIEEELHRKYEASELLKTEKGAGWKRKLADIEKSIKALEEDLEAIRKS